jgi:hypothetical protein
MSGGGDWVGELAVLQANDARIIILKAKTTII